MAKVRMKPVRNIQDIHVYRIQDTTTNNVSFVNPNHVGAAIFDNDPPTSCTIQLALTQTGQGNNQFPITLEVASEDVMDFWDFLEEAWTLELDAVPST